MSTRQMIVVDYEHLKYILKVVEEEQSSIVDTQPYRRIRADLKAQRENPAQRFIRFTIKSDPTLANVRQWYRHMHRDERARITHRVSDDGQITISGTTFPRWNNVDIPAETINVVGKNDYDAYYNFIRRLINRMDRLAYKNKETPLSDEQMTERAKRRAMIEHSITPVKKERPLFSSQIFKEDRLPQHHTGWLGRFKNCLNFA